MGKEFNELNKRFQTLISKKESFEEGKEILLELRKNMYDMLMLVKNGFNPTGFSLMPFKNSNGYESKTMAYSIYHIIRIEDIVCHTLIKNDEQVFEKNEYQKRFAFELYEQLCFAKVDVLLDDRDLRFGTKMTDFELIGSRYALIIGNMLEQKQVEIINRLNLEKQILECINLPQQIIQILNAD